MVAPLPKRLKSCAILVRHRIEYGLSAGSAFLGKLKDPIDITFRRRRLGRQVVRESCAPFLNLLCHFCSPRRSTDQAHTFQQFYILIDIGRERANLVGPIAIIFLVGREQLLDASFSLRKKEEFDEASYTLNGLRGSTHER